MKFVIGSTNVKLFAKSILTLSKIGDEIYVEPLQNSVRYYYYFFKMQTLSAKIVSIRELSTACAVNIML